MANRNIERAVRVALLAAGAVSVGAYSSGAAAQGATPDEVEQIIVTGSRIPQPNIEGTSPVTTVGAADVQLEGVTDSVNLVNQLPQAFAAQGGNISNGGSGTSTLNLRNLGSNRTLVLVNGRRLPAGDPLGPIAPDVNQIPAPLIQRVEVLTGGAGAVYGSDAVAGVVNFIMKDDFEGVEVDGQYSFYNHYNDDNQMQQRVNNRGFSKSPSSANDGDAYDLSILMGSNFADGKGNATVFIGYRDTNAILQSERDYSNCALQTNLSGATTGGGTSPTSYINGARCGGSGTNATGTIYPPDFSTTYTVGPDGNPDPNVQPYNYGPLNYYQRPDKRWTADVFAHYDVTDQAEVYSEFMMMDDHTVAQIAPSGLFGVYYDMPCNGNVNPYQTDAWRDTMCGPRDEETGLYPTDSASIFVLRRNVEGGGRQDDIRHTDYRGVIGVRGQVFEHWNYDLFGQYGTVILNQHVNNYISNSRGVLALDAVTDPDTGLPVCASALTGANPTCVPLNIWGTGAGVTPEALAYAGTQAFSSGNTTQTIVNGTMSSNLGDYGIKMPWASDGIGVAFGIEYRQEGLKYDVDYAYRSADLGGGGGPRLPVKGSYNLMDYFAETRIPIVQDVAFAKDLTLNASYRYSDYSTGINTSTYGIGLDWAPMDDFKLRGSFQHAVRAPNIIELFSQQQIGLYDMDSDPCAGSLFDPVTGAPVPAGTPTGITASGYTLAQCQQGSPGVAAGSWGNVPDSPAGQYNAIFGGNVDLSPEKADTWTAGIVLTPTFFEGFTMTVDYWSIKIDNVIGNVSPVTTVGLCLDSSQFCNLIHRDNAGSLWLSDNSYVYATNQNLGSYETAGIDFNISYNLPIGDWGSLNFSEIATNLDTFKIEEIPHMGKYDCAGYYGATCGTPLPDWKSKFRVMWSTAWNVDLAITWRYIDSVDLDTSSSNPLLAGNVPPFDKTLDSQDYLDVGGTFEFGEHYTLNAGINNILDVEPPLSSNVGTGFGNGNTYPQVYDALGRYIFVGLTAKF
jgi:iron complex outermembrane recepter protein